MSHYINNIDNPHTIDIIIKSGLADTGSYDTYIRPDDPHENADKLGHSIFILSACGNKIPSNTACTLTFPQFPYKGR